MPLISEPTKIDTTPAAGLRAQLSPQRLRNEQQETRFGQTEPNRNLVTDGELLTNDKECKDCKQSGSDAAQQSTFDSVKQGFSAIPEMASNAAHQTAEFVKHIPEHAQHGAHATAEFVKGIHVPESVQHGFSATTEFVRNIPENVQQGAHATAEFVKHLPEKVHLGGSNQKDVPNVDVTPATGGVAADDKALQRAALPASPYEYKTPTSNEKQDYMQHIGRSDSEGMHVHKSCGAARQKCLHQGTDQCDCCKSP